MAKQLNLADPKAHALLWVTDFPMFEWNEEEQRHEALHHPFTAPNQQTADQNGGDLTHAKALAYDLVYNGVEVGGKHDIYFTENLDLWFLGKNEKAAEAKSNA